MAAGLLTLQPSSALHVLAKLQFQKITFNGWRYTYEVKFKGIYHQGLSRIPRIPFFPPCSLLLPGLLSFSCFPVFPVLFCCGGWLFQSILLRFSSSLSLTWLFYFPDEEIEYSMCFFFVRKMFENPIYHPLQDDSDYIFYALELHAIRLFTRISCWRAANRSMVSCSACFPDVGMVWNDLKAGVVLLCTRRSSIIFRLWMFSQDRGHPTHPSHDIEDISKTMT